MTSEQAARQSMVIFSSFRPLVNQGRNFGNGGRLRSNVVFSSSPYQISFVVGRTSNLRGGKGGIVAAMEVITIMHFLSFFISNIDFKPLFLHAYY